MYAPLRRPARACGALRKKVALLLLYLHHTTRARTNTSKGGRPVLWVVLYVRSRPWLYRSAGGLMLASVTWKSGRRRRRSAARAVVGVERVGGGEAAAARAPSTKRGRTPETDAKQGQFDPGGKTQRTQYGRSYPALDLSPVRREGSTGPERPQRRRPDGQECYVESRLAGAKRRRTGKGEETGMPTGRPPGE